MLPVEVRRIIKAIEEEREKRVKEIIEDGRKEVEKIRNEFKYKQRVLREKIIENYVTKAEELRRKEIAEIEIVNREKIMDFKSSIVETVKKDALKRMTGKAYDEFLFNSIKKGVKDIGKNEVEIYVRKSDMEKARGYLKKLGIKAKFNAVKTTGGCMIKSGKLGSNYLIDSIMQRKENAINKKLNDILFGVDNA